MRSELGADIQPMPIVTAQINATTIPAQRARTASR